MRKFIAGICVLICVAMVSCTTFHASLEGLEKADITIEKKAD